MQNIPFHIAYLLTQHECVIVPGFGTFVASPVSPKQASRWGIFSPPGSFLGFNPGITHNDGLLANSLAKGKKISYKEACLLISQYVTDISRRLNEEKNVWIPWVGTLYSENEKIRFQPDRTLSCNANHYGLVDFSIPYLKDLKEPAQVFSEKKTNREVIWVPVSRKLIAYASSVAIAFLAMCIAPTPLNNNQFHSKITQYASIVPFSVLADNKAGVSEKEIREITTSALTQSETVAPKQELQIVSKLVYPQYHIIIASLPNQSAAEKTVAELQSKGFETATILCKKGKYRIYINRFENKSEAELFLNQFRKTHPAYASAWLLKL
jgi:nucleoid DNA-binding protein